MGKTQMKILMLGLDAAGKTTILYKLKLGEVVTSIPTIGMNVETVEYQGKSLVSFTTWDIGGRSPMRPLWRHFYKGCNALIFVIDANDRDRVEDAQEELRRLLNEDELRDWPLLVFGNKQDLPNAMSIAELSEKLCLHQLRNRCWFIQSSCATSGDGLHEGLDWLSATLHGQHNVKSNSIAKQLDTLAMRQKKHVGAETEAKQNLDDEVDRKSFADTESTADTEALDIDA